MEQWKSIEPEMWKPENEGDSIEGILIEKKPRTEAMSAQYKLKNEDGEHLVWGSAVLDDRMVVNDNYFSRWATIKIPAQLI